MRPLKILFLADTRPGHYHLSEGVIAALGRLRPVEVTRIEVNRRWIVPTRWLRRRLHSKGFWPPRMLWMTYRIRAEELPRADLVISAGGETLMPNICCARYLGAPNIFCGSLRDVDAEQFSLVVSSYERDAGSARHIVTLKPSSMDPDSLGRNGVIPRFGPDHRPQRAGLLIGGDAGGFHYRQSEWNALIAFVEAVSLAWGTRWLISTSRRTPDAVADQLAALAQDASAVERFIDFRSAGPGTLPEIYKAAEVIVCTEDSSTMVSEAISARLPVVGVSPAKHRFTREEQDYRTFLLHQDWCRVLPISELTPERFAVALGEIRPIEGNPLDLLASRLRQKLPALLETPDEGLDLRRRDGREGANPHFPHHRQ